MYEIMILSERAELSYTKSPIFGVLYIPVSDFSLSFGQYLFDSMSFPLYLLHIEITVVFLFQQLFHSHCSCLDLLLRKLNQLYNVVTVFRF